MTIIRVGRAQVIDFESVSEGTAFHTERHTTMYTGMISVIQTLVIISPQPKVQVLTREPNQCERLIGSP